LRPDFVLFVGDLIEGYWSQHQAADAHAEWDEIDVKIQASGLPFFPTVGNHDYGNRNMADVWLERKGLDYYAFRVQDTLFLSINTEHTPQEFSEDFIKIIKTVTANFQREPERAQEHLQSFYEEMKATLSPEQMKAMSQVTLNIGEDQLAFFERVLEENADVKWTFVNMHKPGWKSDSEEFRRLERMLADRQHTIFSGHLHSMEYTKQSSSELIQLGRTGGLAHGSGEHAGDENLILWVTMRGGVPTYRVIHLDGVRDIANYQPQQQH
jgi:hypothetical protein